MGRPTRSTHKRVVECADYIVSIPMQPRSCEDSNIRECLSFASSSLRGCISSLVFKYEIRIDRLSLPPSLGVSELEDRKVQVRRVGRRVAGGADVADDVALRDLLA